MPLTEAHLIDGDLFEFVRLGPEKAPRQIPFRNVLNDLPAHSQVPGHIFNGNARYCLAFPSSYP